MEKEISKAKGRARNLHFCWRAKNSLFDTMANVVEWCQASVVKKIISVTCSVCTTTHPECALFGVLNTLPSTVVNISLYDNGNDCKLIIAVLLRCKCSQNGKIVYLASWIIS